MKYAMFAAMVVVAGVLAGCGSTAPPTEAKRAALTDEAQAALKQMTAQDPGLQDVLNNAYGYVIFPSVGKGGFIVSGGFGRGVAYQQGRMIGYADIKQGGVGATIGAESFSELVVFQNEGAMNRFKAGNFDLGANASATALKAGAAKQARFENGVAVFAHTRGGLMADASVSGQKINFVPTGDAGMRDDVNRSTGPTTMPR